MIKVAICDDETLVCKNIMQLIKSLYTDCHIDLYCSGKALLAAGIKYDIYFLDVQMQDINGIDTAKQIRANENQLQNESVIIFITAFRQYMEQAFDVKAFHYLLKPINEIKFKNIFFKAISDCIKMKEFDKKYILIKSGNAHQNLFLRDILYIESQNKKVAINSVHGVFEYYGKMKEIQNMVGKSFYRCHRCYIVNMQHITRYNANSIRLSNGSEIFLAQKKYSEFVKVYMEFARSGDLING